MAIIRFLALALAAIHLLASPAHANWKRADTRHFIIYSDGSTKSLQRSAEDLERFDALMKMLLGLPRDENPYRLPVYIFDDTTQVSNFLDDRSYRTAGFYRASERGSFMVSNRERDAFGLNGRIVLFHEYAHHLMFRYFTNAYPVWYREGFAEYISTTEFEDDGTFTIGAPANHRAYSVRRGNYLPIETLLFSTLTDLKGEDVPQFYAQSWILTHYLQSSRETNLQMLRYFSALSQGRDQREAAEEIFGDLDDLERVVDRYGQGRIDYRKSDTPIAIDGDIVITELSSLESDLAQLNFYYQVNYRLERILYGLRRQLEEHPQDARLLFQLARAVRREAHRDETYDFSQAHQLVDQALAIDPAHVGANLLKAELLMEPADHEEVPGEVDWNEVRKFISAANQANPEDPMPLLAYVDSFQREGREMPEIALGAMQQVFAAMPEATGVRVRLAYLYADEGDYDTALSLVGFLVADPHNGAEGRRLVRELEARRDGVTLEDEGEDGDSAITLEPVN